MELFDMVKAAPPPRTIRASERTSAPPTILLDSPEVIVIEADDGDDLLESVNIITDDESDAGQNEDNNQGRNSGKRGIDLPSVAKPKSKKSSNKSRQNLKKRDKNRVNYSRIESDEDSDEIEIIDQQIKTSNQTSRKPNESEIKTPEKFPGRADFFASLSDTDDSLDGYSKTMPAPTKTKAQQKMFSDSPDQSASGSRRVGEFCAREFCIRIKRVTQSEINSASASVAKSKFASPATRKRGRPRKSGDDKTTPSPAKKLKVSPSPKVHIKVPLQSGSQKRALVNLARTHTPPPILASRSTPKTKRTSVPKGINATPSMVRRYGKRFFSCVVNVKNLKWPSNNPERQLRFGSARKGRPRRSNLSVSFNESVEILGSSEGGSRRSTFGTISSKLPKPTRLQRVDATGNVLEDIAINSNMMFTGNSPSASTSGASGSRAKGKRRSCNGSPQLKRPHQRIPLSGLASLRLDDGSQSDDDDDDEEYIVPNELPGIQRPGTPTPRKKKVSYTTTVSDDEDEKAPPKKTKSNSTKKESKTKTNPKKVDKSTSLKESVLQNVVKQGKSNEIVKEDELKKAADVLGEEDQDAETEDQKVAEVATNEEKDGEKPETPKPVETAEDNPQEAEETTLETDTGAEEKLVEENGEKNPEEESEPRVEENGEKSPEKESEPSVEENCEKEPEEESKANVEQSDGDASESLAMSPLKVEETSSLDRDSKAEQTKVDDVEDFRELDTPPSQPLLPTTEENPEDVLEIQTSLEDVRQLHTPFSSQQSTPQARKPVRQDSVDSDCSFKSAHEPNKDILIAAEGDKAAGEGDTTDAASGEDKSEIDSAAMPAALTTPPPSTPRTVNGCDPMTSDGSTITAYYSPIEAMPTLDDEVLGQLVEPDFQLNSSRHAISRGTLDDIMTALES
ncbi:hypothetical protein KR038_002411 [Drosophila bunnanda]|nr:hypothetical protein KR038_002411 [Drosophila bunnanda]